MTNENETVDVLHELNELHDLIWEYGDDCICLHEGSEGATIESTDKINEKIEFIKREIAAKDAEITRLKPIVKELANDLYSKIGCDDIIRQSKSYKLITKALEVVK